jgi:hypothetical protein
MLFSYRLLVIVLVFGALFLGASGPAAAAAPCGHHAERKAVEKEAVAEFADEGLKLNRTNLLHLVVAHGWARVDVQFKGSYSEWFAHIGGGWIFLGKGTQPAFMPAAIAKKLNIVDGSGFALCPGPHFKNTPSGP